MSHPEGLEIIEDEYNKENRYINASRFTQYPIKKIINFMIIIGKY